jgi:hypothetical protein
MAAAMSSANENEASNNVAVLLLCVRELPICQKAAAKNEKEVMKLIRLVCALHNMGNLLLKLQKWQHCRKRKSEFILFRTQGGIWSSVWLLMMLQGMQILSVLLRPRSKRSMSR